MKDIIFKAMLEVASLVQDIDAETALMFIDIKLCKSDIDINDAEQVDLFIKSFKMLNRLLHHQFKDLIDSKQAKVFEESMPEVMRKTPHYFLDKEKNLGFLSKRLSIYKSYRAEIYKAYSNLIEVGLEK